MDQLAELGGIAPEDDSLKSIRQAISARKKEIKAEEKAAKATEKKEAKMKAAAEKKAVKKASPKSNEYTARRLNDADGNAILGENGSSCRVKIHKENRTVLKVKEDNWTDEAHNRYAELFPEGKDVKKEKTPKAKVAKKSKITKKIPNHLLLRRMMTKRMMNSENSTRKSSRMKRLQNSRERRILRSLLTIPYHSMKE